MTTEGESRGSLGPYIQVACFCENVVQRADGVLTLVNIIDRVTITAQVANAPESMPKSTWRTFLVIVLKAGRARGRHELTITPELPDGSTKTSAILSANFEGSDDRGVQIVTQIVVDLEYEGLYWFNIRFDEELLTRLPLRVLYNRITGGPVGRLPAAPI